ncbi:hypothetical protein FHT44_005041 [Mycolicibacterium sp. BK634]|uniref:hypothetical protein n=1 Tax=Mycolicibacterium sp. BK634 TaxID=2587099 RepID=UPI001620A0C7|nr:hypothetical protein [Mycolicibacterium sp. BK634]MBB3752529.1 hypothetical protein [Mycolicibacterium sp. BK634]
MEEVPVNAWVIPCLVTYAVGVIATFIASWYYTGVWDEMQTAGDAVSAGVEFILWFVISMCIAAIWPVLVAIGLPTLGIAWCIGKVVA